jgi:HemY protein
MFRSLWYLFKILVVVGLVVFLAIQPGTIEISWKEYTFRDIHLGAAAVVIFIFILALVFVTGLLHRLLSLPREFKRYRTEKQRAQGYQALVRSLTAAAVGDHKNAYYQAHRAQKLLPDSEAGIPLLLQAHSAKGRGNVSDTDAAFQSLLGNADTALLGVHGMMQKAMIEGDYTQALRLARETATAQPRNYSLLKPVYDLEIRNRLWNEALVTLDKAVSKKVVEKDAANHDRMAIFCIVGDQAKVDNRQEEAFKYYKKSVDAMPHFAPAVDRLARTYLERDQRIKALDLVKRAWIVNPHPDLLPLWDMLVPHQDKDQRATRYRWFEWVQEFHPNSSFAVLALAKVAIEEGMWGEARAALMRAEKIEPSAQLYRLWVMLEERTGNKAEVIRQWLDRAASTPPAKTWTCQKTGRTFQNWVAVVEPEGFFNTVVWGARSHGSGPGTGNDPSRWLLDRSAA